MERYLRCTLQVHEAGDHRAFVIDLPGGDTGSVWARWGDGSLPRSVSVVADCDVMRGEEPCCEFDGHPGGHTWELLDPWLTTDTAVATVAVSPEGAR